MAETYFWAGGDGVDDNEKGDFERAGNWKKKGGGTGAVPASTDTLIFDKNAGIVPSDYVGTKHTIGKHWNCFYNMDQKAKTFRDVIRSPAFTGRIGTNATDPSPEVPLILNIEADYKLVYRGNEPMLVQCGDTTKSIPLVIHDSVSGLLKISSTGTVPGQFTKIECYNAGTLEVVDETECIEIRNYGTTIVTIHERCFNRTGDAKNITTAVVDNGDGTVRFECTHGGYVAGDYVIIDGSTNYDYIFEVVNVPDATHFDVEAGYVAETPTATAKKGTRIKIYADGGSVESNSPLDEIENYGASIVVGKTTLRLQYPRIDVKSVLNVGGSFTWRAGGKMSACEQRGGNIYVVGDGDKQIGNSGDIFKLLSGVFDASGQYGKLTKGTNCGILVRGATFIPPKGFQIDDWAV